MSREITSEARSYIMSQIKGKNTKPEIKVRKALWALGFRYRIHVKSLAGRPDIVFRRRRLIIFVNGCFWHHHKCQKGRLPNKNREYWRTKLERNLARDKQNVKRLKELGYDVLVLWECEIEKDLEGILRKKILSHRKMYLI